MLSISIETDNAAFADGNQAAECARILREAADRLDHLGTVATGKPSADAAEIPLRDVNGNTAGWLIYRPSWHASRNV